MKKYIIFIMAGILVSTHVWAQLSLSGVLSEVEKNNTSLAAYSLQTKADKIGNNTGIFPKNPEVELNYLWGNPTLAGNRTDLKISQTFDFPTAYIYRKQVSVLKNEQADLLFTQMRKEVLHQTRLVCVQLIYQNALERELNKRADLLSNIARAYKIKFEKGQINILDYNKSQLAWIGVNKQVQMLENEKNALLLQLQNLNGGMSIQLADSAFHAILLNPNFEEWYTLVEQQNTQLQSIKQEKEILQQERKLNTAMFLPQWSAGYMSEKTTGQIFRGITLGVSIPLWENKNTLKQTKALMLATDATEADAKIQFYSRMKAIHAQVMSLQALTSDFQEQISLYSNTELLHKAWEKGEISLPELLLELSLQYEQTEQLLQMQLTLHTAYAELQMYME